MDRIQLLVLIARRTSSTIDESLSTLLDVASDHAHELLRIRTSQRELARVGDRVGKGGKSHESHEMHKLREMYDMRAKEADGIVRRTCHLVLSCLNPLMQLVPDENDRLSAGLSTMSVPELHITFVQKLQDSTRQVVGDALELWRSTVEGDGQAIVRDVADRFEAAMKRRFVRELPYDPSYDDPYHEDPYHDDHGGQHEQHDKRHDERHDFRIPAIHGGRASRNEGAQYATVACIALTAMSAIAGSVAALY
jgi:hypothetical protein